MIHAHSMGMVGTSPITTLAMGRNLDPYNLRKRSMGSFAASPKNGCAAVGCGTGGWWWPSVVSGVRNGSSDHHWPSCNLMVITSNASWSQPVLINGSYGQYLFSMMEFMVVDNQLVVHHWSVMTSSFGNPSFIVDQWCLYSGGSRLVNGSTLVVNLLRD